MSTLDERIEAAKKALEESRTLYTNVERQYDTALALFEQSKARLSQSNSFVNALKNTQVDPLNALKIAASFAPNPQTFNNQINQPGANAQTIQQQQLSEANKQVDVAEKKVKQAEKEVQRLNKALNGVKDQIDSITQQLGAATGDITLSKQAEKEEQINDKKIKQRTKKININNTIALAKQKQDAIKTLAVSAVLYVINRLLNNEVQRLSKTVQRLSELVDRVNDQIESVQTKQDVLNAKISRDAALVELNKAERQIKNIRNIIKTLETIFTIISLALRVLLLIPIPSTPKVVEKIIKATLTLESIVTILGVTKESLNSLIADVQYERSRLLPISDIIDKAIQDNLSPSEISDLLNRSGANIGQLGNLNITYRGFTFAIYEEENPQFVVDGNKRRYAVAFDRSGFIRLRSQASFTLDPDVLVSELKLQIDEQNLEA